MHLQAAAVLRAVAPAMQIAHHLLCSGPTNDDAAVTELREAAKQAKGKAPGAAATFIVRALDLVGEHSSLRAELCAEAVGLLASAGRIAEARRVGETPLRGGLDSQIEANVLLGLAVRPARRA
jgi:phage tail tape-measure protein